MKLTIFLMAIAIVPASAQPGQMKPAPPTSVAAKPVGTLGSSEIVPVPLPTINALEKEMDGRIAATGGSSPCVVLGQTRGLYVSGLGAVFTAEVELSVTPGGVGIFQTQISAEQKAKYRKDKLAHVPLLEQTLRDMALALSASPALKLADTDQVVVATRLVYRPWEDMSGLPGQIVARLDRRGGTVKVEVQ
jgi:hypothetical protein